ncbi:hypothetical protein SAMN05444396_103240 [Flavobacterium segetis]|uniref:Uncharacterized protein n=1 Tax=Flavobacterium segetis TaxID=271157 RepID=A0A1M5G439_9FLAO|nr:hypothetical protein [Flavobacterium segetis]SHF98202.1 hypothetical protein SAMN05444396_103240 [Flavobacterium segetis]
MNITYNESEKTVEIKDGLKSYVFLIKFLMFLNLGNSILNLYDLSTVNFGFAKLIWIFLGAISIIVLYKFFYKKTTSEKIQNDKIKGIGQRIFLGRKKYFLELSNGKTRDLIEVKTDVDFSKLKKILSKAGVQV